MIDFDINKYYEEGSVRSKPLPKGEYNSRVIAVEVRDTKKTKDGNDTSRYLLVKHEVLDGKYLGRQIYNNFNIWHSSEAAKEIGRKQFASLCGAVGMLDIKEVGKLFNTKQIIFVDIESNEKYGDKNKILFYKSYVAPSSIDENKPVESSEEGEFNDDLPF